MLYKLHGWLATRFVMKEISRPEFAALLFVRWLIDCKDAAAMHWHDWKQDRTKPGR
jgi:hypothetical protein